MTIQERIKYLLDTSPDKKPSQLAVYLGTRQSTVDGWTKLNRCPSAEVVPKICNFFNVSTDYLLTGKEPQNHSESHLTDDEIELLSSYRKLSSKDKTMSLAYIYSRLERVPSTQTIPVQMAADTGDEHDRAPQTSLKKQKEAFEHYKD